MSVPVRFPTASMFDPADNRPARRLRAVPSPGPSPTARSLLAQARQGLLGASREADAAERFVQAHLAALRGAAAVLALRGRPHRTKTKPTSAWVLLASLAPEFTEWATFFQACSPTRAAIESGITRLVNPRASDDLVRQAGQFLDLVDRAVHGAGA
ncbi:hypothetical protein GCM10010174_81950 [Kutzneria viridogrisea]|uniref:SAV-6107-like HEPN domain-containing protein n=2 Tax=Kutzneria TaxID=43356 RepID=W5WGV3_9PSEU|nr:SAV_6107 family HEPN domain-containing protein [Kutzneria albida]AHI00083.1 hypothetical protein KALB_6724 [Kutzneria albida DSM 43870]MBA8925262.1 hypothetical protein [Kutzneria viridogrisea]